MITNGANTHIDSATYTITSVVSVVANQPICASGAFGGTDCGSTTHMNSNELWETTGITVVDGDSGGPVLFNHRAHGIIGGNGAGNSLYFTGAVKAQNLLNATIFTG